MKTLRTTRLGLAAAAALALAVASAPTATARAADVGLRPGQSWQTAIQRARPGDRILLHAGTYAGGGWIERSGTAAAPITVVSVDGPRRAVIEGGDESLRVGNSAYLVFDGLEVRNSGNNAVHIDGGSHHITLRNLYVHDAGTNGDVVKINQSHHVTIERSEFARPGRRTTDAADNPYQECLDFVDVDDAAIRDNFIHDGGSMLMLVRGGARNTVIERNVYSQQRAGASDPMVGLGGQTELALLQGERYEVINVVFRNNVLINGVTGGVAVDDASGAYVANNLFLNVDRVLVEFRAGNGPAGGSTGARVVNNLFVDTRGRMPTPYRRSSHTLSDFATASNLFWNAGAAVPSSDLVDVRSQPGHVAADPRVGVPAATANRDAIIAAVRPADGSPAAGSALDATAAPYGVTDDITQTPRGAARDRGPFLLSAPSTTMPPETLPSDRVASVEYTVDPPVGTAGRPSTITARSTGSAAPMYRFWVVTTTGQWTQPCGGYDAADTCTFTPGAAGRWQIAVSARDASSTADYDASATERPYAVVASSGDAAAGPPAADAASEGIEGAQAGIQCGVARPGAPHSRLADSALAGLAAGLAAALRARRRARNVTPAQCARGHCAGLGHATRHLDAPDHFHTVTPAPADPSPQR